MYKKNPNITLPENPDTIVWKYLDLSKFKGDPKVHYIGHHTSHASSAFYNSNFDKNCLFCNWPNSTLHKET